MNPPAPARRKAGRALRRIKDGRIFIRAPGIPGDIRRRAFRFLCRRADCVIVHSRQNEQQIIEAYGLSPERVVRIPMGANTEDIPRISRDEARAALGLPRDAAVVLSFGTIRPYKGIEDLIEAFADVARDRPHARLLIAGKPWMDWGPCEQRIIQAGIADKVQLCLEYIPDERVPLFFSAADVITLPYTHFDAQSAVAARALPYRKPLLVSDVGGLPEWVGREPRWMLPAGDRKALAERIAAVLDDPEGAAAAFRPIAERVLEENNWKRSAQRHIDAYIPPDAP